MKRADIRVILSVGLITVLCLISASYSFGQETAYDKAVKLYLKGDFEGAVSLLKEQVSEKPDAKAYYLLGYASYKLKREDEAAEYFKEGYLLDPRFNPDVILNAIKGGTKEAVPLPQEKTGQ